MNPRRQRKLIFFVFSGTILSLVTGLVLYALRQNISLFYTPSQIANNEAPKERSIRLGGMVVNNSVQRSTRDLSIAFKLTDYKHTITVHYQGILPDLFREGQGIVALGLPLNNREFKATEVLAKHDSNYMPPEVKEALAKAKQPAGILGDQKSG